MVALILAALLAALVVWLLDPLLGSFLHWTTGYLIARTFSDNWLPRNLAGDWTTRFWKYTDEFTEVAHVKQLLDRVWGRIRFQSRNRTYQFHGTIRGDVFVAMYDMKGSKVMDRGSFTLKLNNDGDSMIGRYSWTDDQTHEVKSDKYLWTKMPKA